MHFIAAVSNICRTPVCSDDSPPTPIKLHLHLKLSLKGTRPKYFPTNDYQCITTYHYFQRFTHIAHK